MEIGGAEISLVGLLNAIDYTRYDVDLFIYSHRGEFMSLIPEQVNILPESKKYASIEMPMRTVLVQGYWDIIVARLLARFRFQAYAKKHKLIESAAHFQYISNATTPLLGSLEKYGEYDVAISFLAPHNIVRDKVKAKKKIAWIHTDYTNVSANVELEVPVWDSFDHIISISEQVSDTFSLIFPSLRSKLVLMENILSPQFVRARSEMSKVDDMPHSNGEHRFLSIGRYTRQKNFDNVPSIAKRLIDKGLKFKWYLVGYGSEEGLIRDKIVEAGVEDTVIMLGKKPNPNPYIATCDYYIQPSRWEGKSVTVREAQMLYKPVIVTDYPTAGSQIKHGVDGVIVPMDNEGCANGIFDFVSNTSLRDGIVECLHSNDYGNEHEVEQLYKLI